MKNNKKSTHALALAEQGSVDAQFNLGIMYNYGAGVAQDYQQAYAWFSSAAANGSAAAVQFRDSVAKQLTPSALAQAQALGGEYFQIYSSRH